MTETIFTKHPQKGRSGREISKQKYDIVRSAITEVLAVAANPLSQERLMRALEERLSKTPFPGDVRWYSEVVKLDLEARKLIRRVKDGKKEAYELWPDIRI
jgi:hypothetical protein